MPGTLVAGILLNQYFPVWKRRRGPSATLNRPSRLD